MSITSNLFKLIERGKEGKNKGLSTGLDRLDRIIYGVQRRCIVTIGGDTGSGKSTLALYMYVYKPLTDMLNANKDINILYFSFEMSAEVLFAKLLSIYVFENFDKIITYEQILSLTETLSDEDYYYIDCGREWLTKVEDKISVVDKPLNSDQVESVLRQFTSAFGYFEKVSDTQEIYHPNNPEQYLICILDHVGLMEGGMLKYEIDQTVKHFIYYRNIASITGIFIQQLNRNFKSMDRKNSVYNMVQLNDFSDSSGPSQGSETVLAIFDAHREKQRKCLGYDIDMLKDRFRAVSVLKNRFGLSNKSIGLNFFGEIGYWRELPKSEEVTDTSKYLYLHEGKVEDEPKQIDTTQKDSNLYLTV